jgi:hypothetical protein
VCATATRARPATPISTSTYPARAAKACREEARPNRPQGPPDAPSRPGQRHTTATSQVPTGASTTEAGKRTVAGAPHLPQCRQCRQCQTGLVVAHGILLGTPLHREPARGVLSCALAAESHRAPHAVSAPLLRSCSSPRSSGRSISVGGSEVIGLGLAPGRLHPLAKRPLDRMALPIAPCLDRPAHAVLRASRPHGRHGTLAAPAQRGSIRALRVVPHGAVGGASLDLVVVSVRGSGTSGLARRHGLPVRGVDDGVGFFKHVSSPTCPTPCAEQNAPLGPGRRTSLLRSYP